MRKRFAFISIFKDQGSIENFELLTCNSAGDNLLKALSMGANTVKGPGPDRMPSRPATFIAFSRLFSLEI